MVVCVHIMVCWLWRHTVSAVATNISKDAQIPPSDSKWVGLDEPANQNAKGGDVHEAPNRRLGPLAIRAYKTHRWVVTRKPYNANCCR